LEINPIEEPKYSISYVEFEIFKQDNMLDDEGGVGAPTSNVEYNFVFPILDPTTTMKMKNIPPSTLPNFHRMVNEDLEAL